jgi:hypothetical protein
MLPALTHTSLPSTLLADVNLARNYARQALSQATRTAYDSDWRVFEKWCADRGVEALPASPASVAAFMAAMAERGLRPATIVQPSGTIIVSRGVDPLPTDAAIVKTTMKGCGARSALRRPRRRRYQMSLQSVWSTPHRT